MIQVNTNVFECHTKHTTYCFHILPSGQLEHLYYGKRINFSGYYDAIIPKCEFIGGNLIAYDESFPAISLEARCLEMSSLGKGDIREPMIALQYYDGVTTCNFVYDSYEIIDKQALRKLPSSYDEHNTTQSLIINLIDKTYHVTLQMIYSIFYDTDIIVRSTRLLNNGEQPLTIRRLLSCQIDWAKHPLEFTTFRGAWAREMNRYTSKCETGILINDSKTGTSSNRCNPFVMISSLDTTETTGNCYACNLIYSGNHYEALEPTELGTTRFVCGIQPQGFSYELAPNDVFESPEAVLTYSHQGYHGVSQHMHHFVKEHIVRGAWKYKERPILINSWEAAYFDVCESQLLKLAKTASRVGIELFVLDDGWFGKRNDDTCALGDWYVNTKKLGGGLTRLAKKVNALGMDFGIWVEPEMISIDSDCYRNHPEYAVNSSGDYQSLGRHQLLIDLTKVEVQDYVIEQIGAVLKSANITYVKWDMNRIFTDCYSDSIPANRQGEFLHRYMLGLYHVVDELTNQYPYVLFEGCSSGGNRFDLGMLCYMPQIWASDNTDASCRATIQTGYSYGYPMSTITAHVSDCPNHQTLRITPIDTRFHIACFGLLGYECNLSDLKAEELQAIKSQVEWYKKYRKILQFGNYHRLLNKNGIYQWMVVDSAKDFALVLYYQTQVTPNYSHNHLRLRGLDPEATYHITNRKLVVNLKVFGDLLNRTLPIHVKKDSPLYHIICKAVQKESETEDIIAQGEVLNEIGVQLKQGFVGLGYNEEVRLFQDYASRVYVVERVCE
ncbi:MAG: alpha-galactosidase [Eubacteriales bacterium]